MNILIKSLNEESWKDLVQLFESSHQCRECLYIKPDFRGKRISSELIKRAIELAKSHGAEK